jgi:hypothetical protein
MFEKQVVDEVQHLQAQMAALRHKYGSYCSQTVQEALRSAHAIIDLAVDTAEASYWLKQQPAKGEHSMKTFYISHNMSHHGDFSDIACASTPDGQLIAVQGIAVEDLSAEERAQFGNQTSAYTFKVQATDYNAACDKVSALLPEE